MFSSHMSRLYFAMSGFFICLILELCEISDIFFLSHFEPVSGSQSSHYGRALVLRP